MVPVLGRPRFQRALVRALAFVLTVVVVRWLPAQTFTPRPAGVAGTSGVASQAQGGSADDGAATIKVNFPNTPIQGIIPVYQQITGKKMILDGSLQGESLKIIGTRPLTKKEAISFIEASLLLNGYAVVKVDDQTVKLIHHSGGKDPSSEGIPVFSSIKDLPVEEQIVHFVLPLQNISPEEAAKAFTTVVKLHPYGAITPVNNTSNIIIKENTATIRSIYELAQIIDVPPAEIANEMIELKRSDAEGIAEIIQEIYEEKEKSENAPRSVRGEAAPAVPGAPGQAAAASGASPSDTNPTAAKVKVIPHRRTNSLLVIARPVDIEYIKALVLKLDKEAGESNFLERKLKYMPVAEFIAIAKDALSRDTDIESDEGSSGGSSSSRRSSRSRNTSNTPSTDAMQASRNSFNGSGGGFNSGYGNGGGYGNNGGNREHSSLEGPDDVGAPESVVVGKTLLIADTRSNTLIVNGSPEHILIVDKLIERMDIRPQQIYISTIIGQLNLGNTYDYGLDLLRGLDDFTLRQTPPPGSTTGTDTGTDTGTGTGLGTGTGTGINTGIGSTLGNTAALAAGTLDVPLNFSGLDMSQFNLYGQLGALSRYIHLLDGNKNFKVLSRPSVYLRNNEKATISSGQRIAVPVSTLSNVGAGVGSTAAVSSSIEYRDVVLKLEVVPLINSDDEVTLKIAQVNDNVVGQQTIGGNSIPTIGTQELVTTVSVKDGSTVVLGGLINEREQTTENGIIFLRRIPVLKHLFNRTQKTKDREELLIFIQPKIIRSADPLDLPNSIEAGRSKVLEAGLNFATEQPEIRKAEPAR